MPRNMPVMDELYQISDKLQQAVKPNSTDGAVSLSPNFSEPEIKPASEAKPPVLPSPAPLGKKLEEALLRRREEYCRTRKDLAAQVADLRAELQLDAQTCRDSLTRLEEPARKLDSYAERLRQPIPDDLVPSNQERLAEECRALENMRLELIAFQRLKHKTVQPDSNSAVSDHVPVLPDLPFGRLFRAGFIFALPLILTLLFTTFFLAFAIVAAFNGAIRW